MNGKITYHQQVSYCGKPHCRRCREGIGHGPYWYAYQTVNGRTIRTYVGKRPPAEMQGAKDEAQNPISQNLVDAVVRLYVLGQFRLEYRTEQQQWQPATDTAIQHQRVRALLNCLISSPGRKLGREQAIEMLWPDLDFETATHRLDRAVYSLRRLFEPGRSRPATSNLLLTEHQVLQLAGQAQLWIDADAFDSLLSQARATNDPGQAEQLLEEAMLFYNGDYLPEERDIPWIQTRRESLQRSWIGLLLELADLRIAREALPSAIDTLDRLLAIDPTNEAGVQRLIILLTQSGRRAEAMRIYQRFVSALRQEYKIAPLPETRALYETARRGEDPAASTQPGEASRNLLANTQAANRQVSDAHAYVQVGRSNQSPLVGRDHELALLHQLLLAIEQTRRMKLAGQKKTLNLTVDSQRRPQFILLMGDVGIGKTRLAEETGREAKRRGWAVAWTRAYAQESSIPYRMWIEALRKAMVQGIWQRQEIARRPLIYQSLSTLLPELHDLLAQESLSSIAPPEQEQLRLWEAVRALLATISESTSLFIVLDDLQWADSSSCELLAFLVRQLRGQPIMIVGTCRDIELPPNHPLRRLLIDLQREQAVEMLNIQRLTDEQIRALVSHLPEPIVQHIQARAAGNPFFAEELARGIGTSNFEPGTEPQFIPPMMAQTRDTASAKDPVQISTLPDTISAVLDLRMGRISSACRRLLIRAAVLGGSFEFNMLRLIESGGPDADEDTILDLLEEALQAGMLTEEGSGTRITYHFWHPLLVSHLYDGLSAGRRASLHRRAAEALREMYRGREEEGAAAIAYHLDNGGAEPSQVAHYAELAGDRAYTLSAYPEAERHYRLAVEHRGILPADAGREEQLRLANLLERLGEVTMNQGKFEDARRFYERVLEERNLQRRFNSQTEYQQEAQLQALCWREIGLTWRYTGNNRLAQQCRLRGEQILQEAGVVGGPAWANLRFQYSSICWQEGKYEEALSAANDALTLFEKTLSQPQIEVTVPPSTRLQRTLKGDPVDLGRMHTLLAGIAATVGQSTGALNHLKASLAIFEHYDCQREIAIVCGNMGDVHLRKAEYTLAQAVFRRSLNIAEQIGDIPIMCVGFGNLGILSARFGDLAEAEAWYKRGLALAEQVNDPVYISQLYSYLATVMQDQGKLDEAGSSLRRALTIGRVMNIAPCIGFALVALGNFRIAQAIVCGEGKIGSSRAIKQEYNHPYLRFLRRAKVSLKHVLVFEGLEAETRTEGQLALAKVSLLLGELEVAKQQVIQTMKEAHSYEFIWLIARSHRLLGSILAAQGQQGQADASFVQAIEEFHKCGMRLDRARTLQSYGEVLLQRGDTGEESYQLGLNYLQEAHQAFRECNAVLDLREVERILSFYTESTTTSTEKNIKRGH